ncbi:hypothetical protein N657DRAFT_433295 [Parathielavia appendiculata]|uniref:Uncharacterized protein n=1 Tax=Parathielavia appendiculata TaxID=2587402 RepID=A0AAN6U036_9PEZI|nr:hypothetical protein N657DRAFT_433295 [Parathielavia appendiculata]
MRRMTALSHTSVPPLTTRPRERGENRGVAVPSSRAVPETSTELSLLAYIPTAPPLPPTFHAKAPQREP